MGYSAWRYVADEGDAGKLWIGGYSGVPWMPRVARAISGSGNGGNCSRAILSMSRKRFDLSLEEGIE